MITRFQINTLLLYSYLSALDLQLLATWVCSLCMQVNQVWVFLLEDNQFPTDTLSYAHSSFCPLELPQSSLFLQLLLCYVGMAKNFIWILLSERTFQPAQQFIHQRVSCKDKIKWISIDGAASGTGPILNKLLLIILLPPQCSKSWRLRKWIDTQRVTIQSV